ncbi:NAD(P)/FAD-dependent oxidoreductase [Candidatus Formimonas warabiya]|uniref:Pyridine nucleotide-disulfide oxidoreductase n=1 Tax=Formimonas warabiya TaxID=1761012 RepID=A0A3G1KM14_FORW1|nr:NAD(P)/FAD-dependent oxidoreductase [Candidatus Formimonas warabiya]ATW23482.1 pyridine nucleotide-disulfide oxidoreductase [Candidatus Formimonas warabiya]
MNEINIEEKDAVIIGAGPAGLAAALMLKKKGIKNIVILEREKNPGGILRQCIHDGFGLVRFKEQLSGPEYAQKFIDEILAQNISLYTGAAVTGLTKDRLVTVVTKDGLRKYQAKAVILAMGCRERTRGALGIPGTRPAGIYTAGVAQSFINLKNLMVGHKIVILGSGDIGLIMARRLTLEGAEVLAVIEKLPYPSGLPRNIQQCLNDYGIPLYLRHTVTDIKGRGRVENVTVSQVDDAGLPVPGTEKEYACDTVVLSVGLIPENELTKQAGIAIDPRTNGPIVDENMHTSVDGIFAAGNVLHVHDLVDYVSWEGEKLGQAAARYITGQTLPAPLIKILPDSSIGNIVPQVISGGQDVEISLRVGRPWRDRAIVFKQGDAVIKKVKQKRLNPPEMVHVKLKKDSLKSGKNIMVGVE